MPASLSDLFATALDPLLLLGHDHRIALAGEGLRSVLGHAPDDLLGEPLADLVHPDDRPWMHAALQKLGREAPLATFEGRMLHADGTERWLTWTFRRSPEGEVYGLGRDESLRRGIEQGVRARERRRTAMLDHAADPLLVFDTHARVVDLNAAARRLFGLAPGALPDEPVTALFPALATHGIEHGRPLQTRIDGPGGPVHLEIRTLAFTFEDERLVVAVARDIGHHLENAERLADLSVRTALENEATAGFVAELSHALRTPLANILGYVDLLLEDGGAGELVRIRAAAGWMLELTDDVLDLGQVASSAQLPTLAPFEPSELLEDLLDALEHRLPPVSLDLRLPPGALVSDADRLRRAFTVVLLVAGRRATSGLSIRLRPSGPNEHGVLAVDIADDGPTLGANALLHLFEPYGSSGPGPTRGSALGLPIARRLITSLGGTLDATSRAGQGAVFTVCLPDRASPG